jgi:CHAT domain-containing protein/Tfp pilus assembly protein PilF
MRVHVAWAFVLLCLIPLRDASSGNVEMAYEHARQLFLHGYLEASQHEADHGYHRFQNSDPKWTAKFQLLEAEAMAWRGMYDDALRLLSELPSPLHNSEETVQKLTTEAVALTHQRQFSDANQRLSEAENLCASRINAACGDVLMARGVFSVKHGRPVEAHQVFLQGLSFARAHHDRWLETSAFLNLGWASLQNEHYDEVLDWSSSAYRIAAELGLEDLAQVSSGNLGWAYFRLGDAEKALELFLDAEKSAVKLGNVRDELTWLTDVGYVYTDAGRIEAAKQAYGRALQLARQINNKEDISDILTDLGLVAVASGNADDADAYATQALSMAQQSGSRPDMLDAIAIQMQAAALRGDTPVAEHLLHEVEVAPESQTSMKWASQRAMARLYEKQGQITKAQTSYLSALITFENARSDIQNVNSQLPFLANATGIYDDYIHFLVSQGKSDQALSAADQSRARTLAQDLNPTPTTQTKQSAFRPVALNPQAIARKAEATLLFYWLGEKQSYLWAITPEKTALFPLPPQAEVTARIARYRKALVGPEDPLEAANPDGQALYTMLVSPAAELLRKNPNHPVMILSDGELSQLNFETLLVPGPTPHYWIDDAIILSAPSLSMLATAKPSRITDRKLLLMGDAISPGEEYAGLPHAASEIRQIEKHFAARDQLVFTQAQATPAAYLSSNPRQFAYIHFVSHGVASRTDPLDSAIILSRASTAEDSFKLYAREVMQHTIDARLVTISACYGSGTRAYAGEGLVGLSWAFLRAGAHNAVGALWEASDESTPGLMDTFYQGLQDGQAPGAALRQAKLTLLHSRSVFRKPLYWAPFQMYTRL